MPLAGVTVSHGASSDAVNDERPAAGVGTLSVFAAGLAPPAVPLNDSDAGETASTGGGGGRPACPST